MNRILPGTLFITACWLLCAGIRRSCDVERLSEGNNIIEAKLAIAAGQSSEGSNDAPPYLRNSFPGSRQFKTVYGTIQIFEWGPEDGEKVLMIHGLGTPCIALGDMAKEFVSRGCRVMIYDLFGRGYSDASSDLKYDARLYTFQILAVLSSSPLSWTGAAGFHLVGFSLGGSIAVAFAAHHATMLRSLTLVAPGGLIRPSHISHKAHYIYYSRLLPDWVRLKLMRNSLEPKHGVISAENPDEIVQADIDFDEVPIAADRPHVKIGDVVRWQLNHNPGFVQAYLGTVLSALVYGHDCEMWKILAEQLARRRLENAPPGLPTGKLCLVLAERDVVVVKDEFLEDLKGFLCEKDTDLYILNGGHEIAITKGKEIASIAMQSWAQKRHGDAKWNI